MPTMIRCRSVLNLEQIIKDSVHENVFVDWVKSGSVWLATNFSRAVLTPRPLRVRKRPVIDPLRSMQHLTIPRIR
jgi:hypothetical protein